MKKIIFLVPLIFSFAFAQNLSILAAASLKYALDAIIKEYKITHKDINFSVNYIASGQAYSQILNGNKAEIFLSADTKYPQKLYDAKLSAKPVIYAIGNLVLWTNDKDFKLQNLNDIKNARHIASADPKLAPYGRATFEFLKNEKMLDEVKSKIVIGKSIGQATSLVKSGAATVGFSALSLLISQKDINYIKIDNSKYSPIEQAFTLTLAGEKSTVAREFAKFLTGKIAREKFLQYGYLLPKIDE